MSRHLVVNSPEEEIKVNIIHEIALLHSKIAEKQLPEFKIRKCWYISGLSNTSIHTI